MRFVVMQFQPIWQNVTQSLQRLEVQFQQFFCESENLPAGQKQICVCLPEMFASGFSMHPALFAEEINGQISRLLGDLARSYGVAIIAGVVQTQHGVYFNRALFVNSLGEINASYTKQKLFSFAGENRVYQAGNAVERVSLSKDFTIAVVICYDLRFPELFREVATEVQMFVVLANWPQTRQKHWEVLLQARAIENQCYVLGVNRIGVDGNGLEYAGGSMLFDPFGERLFDAQTSEIAAFELALSKVSHDIDVYRQTFTALMDR